MHIFRYGGGEMRSEMRNGGTFIDRRYRERMVVITVHCVISPILS